MDWWNETEQNMEQILAENGIMVDFSVQIVYFKRTSRHKLSQIEDFKMFCRTNFRKIRESFYVGSIAMQKFEYTLKF